MDVAPALNYKPCRNNNDTNTRHSNCRWK